jgi:hypothetical protein
MSEVLNIPYLNVPDAGTGFRISTNANGASSRSFDVFFNGVDKTVIPPFDFANDKGRVVVKLHSKVPTLGVLKIERDVSLSKYLRVVPISGNKTEIDSITLVNVKNTPITLLSGFICRITCPVDAVLVNSTPETYDADVARAAFDFHLRMARSLNPMQLDLFKKSMADKYPNSADIKTSTEPSKASDTVKESENGSPQEVQTPITWTREMLNDWIDSIIAGFSRQGPRYYDDVCVDLFTEEMADKIVSSPRLVCYWCFLPYTLLTEKRIETILTTDPSMVFSMDRRYITNVVIFACVDSYFTKNINISIKRGSFLSRLIELLYNFKEISRDPVDECVAELCVKYPDQFIPIMGDCNEWKKEIYPAVLEKDPSLIKQMTSYLDGLKFKVSF